MLRFWRLDKSMKIGTRSVLFGAHQFLIHPWFVAAGWWKLYGFPFDPRLWFAFFFHDIGYLGKPNMDGEEGERHVELGARIMHALFDGWEPAPRRPRPARYNNGGPGRCWECGRSSHPWRSRCGLRRSTRWQEFCLYHSRFYARRDSKPVSRLCFADKLAICLTPHWLYLPMTRWTGELKEYMARSEQKEGAKYRNMVNYATDERQWFENMRGYLRRWIDEHKDKGCDMWTPIVGASER